jgi:hypothetical protein
MGIKIHKRALGDALWSLLGGLIGGVAVGAVTVDRYLRTRPVTGLPPKEQAR